MAHRLGLSLCCARAFTGYGIPTRSERRCWRLVVDRSHHPSHRHRSLVFDEAERNTVTLRVDEEGRRCITHKPRRPGLGREAAYGGSVSTPASARSLNPPMLNTAVYPMS